MTKARENKLTVVLLAAAVLSAGLLGTVNASKQVTDKTGQHITTGHTTFVDASTTFNDCFAGLAGAVLQRVTWFGGQTLFTRMDDGDDQWIYVTEHLVGDGEETLDPTDGGAQYNKTTGIAVRDPSNERLYETDRDFTFQDPNDKPDANDPDGTTWEVQEYFAIREQKQTVEEDVGGNKEQESTDTEKVYTFAVKTGDTITDPQRGEYNFAMVIDTCRFHHVAHQSEIEHNKTEAWGTDPSQHGTKDGNHTHDQFAVDIWIGGPPEPVNDVNGTEVPDDRDGQDPGDGTNSSK